MTALVSLIGFTAGCDRQRESLAAAIAPRNAQQATSTVNQELSAGNFKEARAEGESFLAANQDPSGQLAWSLAKACAQLGDADATIKYASQAIAARAISTVDLMAEPMLEPVRTDPRLVTLAAGMPASTGSLQTPAPQPAPAAASAAIGANGIEARAGSVSVRLPD